MAAWQGMYVRQTAVGAIADCVRSRPCAGRVGFDYDFGTSRTLSSAADATFADSSGKDVFQARMPVARDLPGLSAMRLAQALRPAASTHCLGAAWLSRVATQIMRRAAAWRTACFSQPPSPC